MLSTAANLINKLACEHDLSDAELLTLITSTEPDINKLLACEADKLRRQYYGDKVYIRSRSHIAEHRIAMCLIAPQMIEFFIMSHK